MDTEPSTKRFSSQYLVLKLIAAVHVIFHHSFPSVFIIASVARLYFYFARLFKIFPQPFRSRPYPSLAVDLGLDVLFDVRPPLHLILRPLMSINKRIFFLVCLDRAHLCLRISVFDHQIWQQSIVNVVNQVFQGKLLKIGICM